jgi:hypothetical protein
MPPQTYVPVVVWSHAGVGASQELSKFRVHDPPQMRVPVVVNCAQEGSGAVHVLEKDWLQGSPQLSVP